MFIFLFRSYGRGFFLVWVDGGIYELRLLFLEY